MLHKYLVALIPVLVTVESSGVYPSIPSSIASVHGRWVDSALDGLVTGLARKTLQRLPRWYQPIFKSCFHSSRKNVTHKAYCLSMAFDRQMKSDMNSFSSDSKYSRYSLNTQRRTKRRADRLIDPLTPYETYLGNEIDHQRSATSSKREQESFQMKQPNFGVELFGAAARLMEFSASSSDRGSNYESWQRLQRLMRLSKTQNSDSIHSSLKFSNSDKNIGFVRLMHDFAEVARQEQKSTLSLFSPKFLSLSLDDPKAQRLFSPRFLSLQRDEAFSLEHLVETLDPVNKKEWMNLLLEVTGANQAAKQVLDWIDSDSANSTSNERHKLAKAHLKLVEHWATYMDSFQKSQIDELNKFGFTILDDSQLNVVFRHHGPFNRSHLESFSYRHRDYISKELALETDIRQLALGSFHRRQKQSLLEPAIFAPGILAPSILGHVTLSPSLFAPAILSPAALAPAVLSPTGFSPLVLSPVVLSPAVLSPLMFSPTVLSPLALSPNILNPFMMSPTILGPGVLNPDILSPSILDGVVLSPVALSPSILSPSALIFDVLSPSVLS